MNIIVKAVAGSHLFGTNTESSDKDFKGVYLPSAEDILLQNIKTTIHNSTNPSDKKNTKDDVDCEFYSLDKFLWMLYEGQTVAIELLFTPKCMILESSPTWDYIVSRREELVHKKVKAFIGYCKMQSSKYGVKGSRMGALETCINVLKGIPQDWRMKEAFPTFLPYLNEHIEFIDLPANKSKDSPLIEHLSICGRKFDGTNNTKYVREILQRIYDEYGERAKLAKENKNIDWKAISHCLRVCYQAKELLTTGFLTLPHPKEQAAYLIAVKTGKLNFNHVQGEIERSMEEIEQLEKTSVLRPEIDKTIINNLITGIYSSQITRKYP